MPVVLVGKAPLQRNKDAVSSVRFRSGCLIFNEHLCRHKTRVVENITALANWWHCGQYIIATRRSRRGGGNEMVYKCNSTSEACSNFVFKVDEEADDTALNKRCLQSQGQGCLASILSPRLVTSAVGKNAIKWTFFASVSKSSSLRTMKGLINTASTCASSQLCPSASMTRQCTSSKNKR
jgi:hypothetical protein